MFVAYRLVPLAFLLIVPPVSAQAIHQTASDTARATLAAAMKQDLGRLLDAQDAFLARHHTYSAELPAAYFATRPERQVVIIAHGDKGYSATITTLEEPGLACGLFVGVGVAPSPVIASAREPGCWRTLPSGTIVSD